MFHVKWPWSYYSAVGTRPRCGPGHMDHLTMALSTAVYTLSPINSQFQFLLTVTTIWDASGVKWLKYIPHDRNVFVSQPQTFEACHIPPSSCIMSAYCMYYHHHTKEKCKTNKQINLSTLQRLTILMLDQKKMGDFGRHNGIGKGLVLCKSSDFNNCQWICLYFSVSRGQESVNHVLKTSLSYLSSP